MNPAKQPRKEVRAQAIVEFALALPVLLLVIYGLLETGRLLFIYASTVTAARQAVRYGSATGVNGSGIPYYQDCAGIRAAVHNVGFINRFNDADIDISYDGGPADTNPPSACPPTSIQNGDRIHVAVSTQWTPIVPFLPLQPFQIQSESYRTILASVAIVVEAPPSGWEGSGSGELTLALADPPVTYSAVGEILSYNYTLANTGADALTGPFNLSVTKTGNTTSTSCDAVPVSLPGDDPTSYPCPVSLAATQADLDAGSIDTDAQAFGTGSSSNIVTTSVPATQLPALQLTKTASPTVAASAGTIITYTYTLTNIGNVSLTSPYDVSDNKLNNVDCSGAVSPLPPGASTTCTKDYDIKNPDISAGSVTNVATATATFGSGTVTSNASTATVNTSPLILNVTVAPVSVNQAQTITYTYRLRNNTAADFTQPYNITNSLAGITVDCSGADDPLQPGDTTTCTGTYSVTQAHLDAGVPIANTSDSTAQNSGQTLGSNFVNTSVAVVSTPSLSLALSASPTTATTLDTVVTYTYTLTNAGNVTLSPPFAVADNKVSNITCADPSTALPPGGTKTCTGTHTISQADLDAGTVTNQATASANYGTQSPTSTTQSTTVITYVGARLNLTVTPNPTSVTGTGAIITYTYTLTNTGNVALTSPFIVADDKSTNEDCSLAASPLGVGASTTCTGTYSTTAADVSAGSVTDTATASGMDSGATVTSAPASSTVSVTAPGVCSIKHSVLKLPPSSPFGMTIFNNNSYSVTISSITIYFNDSPSDQRIERLRIGGVNIWTNNANHGSPKTINSGWINSGSLTIPANNSRLLEIAEWDEAYTVNWAERIIISFTNAGCPDLDSSNNSQLQ